jgi:hypothetical protein
MSTAHLVVRQLNGITRQACTSGTTRTNPESEDSSMTRSTRVALHDPHGVSTIPLTNPPQEHGTIFSCASMELQATEPSRRWQPPRVTSTIGLQHGHLGPLDATSRCIHSRIAHSLNWMNNIKQEWVGELPSTLKHGHCWRWITSIFYMWINKRNGSSTRIYIGIGFKLTNSTSFGESLFFTGLFQKM